jgi:hypothetical protein
LRSLAFTLNKIWLDDHRVMQGYAQQEEESMQMPMAAEDA